MSYSGLLLDGASRVRERVSDHPFVKGLGDGSLPVEKFRFYMGQDYLFLIQYCRVLALAAARESDLETMGRFGELLHATLGVEMDLHRGYAAEFGLGREDLESTLPAAVTHAYTSHLLNVAWGGSLLEVAASLLPCQWGYWELGCELARLPGAVAPTNRYRAWVETYSAPAFGELAVWLRGLVDSLAEGRPPGDLARAERHFTASSRYELMFWQMSWEGQAWLV